MYIADLHIHSKYSRATSRDCDAPHLALWARRKGIKLIGTGDFTHPAWREELRAALVPAEPGLYMLREELCLPDAFGHGETPRFVVTGEISTIYKKNGKTRKVHSLILLPGLEAADALALRLERIGNIHSDGRPILGLDCRDLLAITLETCPEALFIPAHIWTPHFALFGAFSGFDTLEECFEDLSGEIHALETGLSSDPPMNWQLSALDRFTLVSNSDAHSPAKLGREANLIEAALSYPALVQAIKTREGFAGTIEFFPEEGKYHLDGHRNCQQRLEPEDTIRLDGKCPVCGKRVTIGVLHRTLELADRAAGFIPPNANPFESLVPLPELIAAATGFSAAGRKVAEQYEGLLREMGPEFHILRTAAPEDIEHVAGPCIAEGIRRLRAGRVARIPGYDGEYGQILLFGPGEREALMGQTSFFGAPKVKRDRKKVEVKLPQKGQQQGTPAQKPEIGEERNEEQQSAVICAAPRIAVIAGPGTGKTKTLVARIAYLIENCGVKPTEITAVTFTNLAAAEMRERLQARLGGKRAIQGMHIGTFHAICLRLLDARPLLGADEALYLVREILGAGSKAEAEAALRGISRVKGGASYTEAGVDPLVYAQYCTRCKEMGLRDLDDLLLDALSLDTGKLRMFTHLLVDEFQDINAVQRQLVCHWSRGAESLFVIGDPDQSIYGFRGANARCFLELQEDYPDLYTIALKRNYRSSPQILASALQVISHNPGSPRFLEASCPSGLPLRLVRADNPFLEAMWVAKEIARMVGGVDMLEAQSVEIEGREPRAFSEIAVLCRTHRQLVQIESCLQHDSIPCIVSGHGDYLQNEAVQGALAFFRFLLCPQDVPALNRALRLLWKRPNMQIEGIRAAGEEPDALRAALANVGCPAQCLADWDTYLPRVRKDKPRRLLERWAAEHDGGDAMNQLLDTAIFHTGMEAFLEALRLGEEADLRRASGKRYASGAVQLMTLHGAKGLEFPVVFLAGLSAGQLPLTREDRPIDPEEERRLFFVGMTRAREELILTTAGQPSAFLDELPETVQGEKAQTQRRASEGRQLKLF